MSPHPDTETEVRDRVALASRVLAADGQGDLVWGHASIRDPAGRGAWIKASGWGMDEVRRDRVHLVGPDGEIVAGDGGRHSEWPIHTEILGTRGDVGAVVHTHAPHCVALAAAGEPLRPVSHAATIVWPPEVPRFEETTDLILTRELGRRVAYQLGQARALFLLNHGMVTVGATIEEAVVVAVILEQACRQQILTRQAGGIAHHTGAEEALAKREHVYHPAAISSVWDYLVRRVGTAPGG